VAATPPPRQAPRGFRTDDLVAFVTQRDWDGPRWASATARNDRIALQSLFGWAHHADRIPIDPAWRLGQLVPIRGARVWQPHWLTEHQTAALLRSTEGADLGSCSRGNSGSTRCATANTPWCPVSRATTDWMLD
jgi:hypothetical protein